MSINLVSYSAVLDDLHSHLPHSHDILLHISVPTCSCGFPGRDPEKSQNVLRTQVLCMFAETVDHLPLGSHSHVQSSLDLHTSLQTAVNFCDGRRALSHQDALWATAGGMFTTSYDVDSGWTEMLACPALWLDSRSQLWQWYPGVISVVSPQNSHLTKSSEP